MKIECNKQEEIDEFSRWFKDDVEVSKNNLISEEYNSLGDETYLQLDYERLVIGINSISHIMENLEASFTDQPVTNNVTSVDTLVILKFIFEDNYGHCLHDYIPFLMYIDAHWQADAIVISETPILRSLLNLLDIKFNKIVCIKPLDCVEFKMKCINMFRFEVSKHRARRLSELVKKHIDTHITSSYAIEDRNRLIYCTRNSSTDVLHGRLMNPDNEREIISILEEHAVDNDMRFTLFDGQKDGVTMSHEEQLKLFRESQFVIGPHGSAVANVIYMDSAINPVVCEFCSGLDPIIHGVKPFVKNYNTLNSYILDDIYDYYIIPFDKESTSDITSINIANLKQLLSRL